MSEGVERNQISKGFQKKTSVTYEALKRGCQKIQDDASWEQQKQTRDWLGPEVKNLKRKFNKIKSKLFLVAKERAGRLYMKVNEEMNRVSVKISRIKMKKSKRNQISEKRYD